MPGWGGGSWHATGSHYPRQGKWTIAGGRARILDIPSAGQGVHAVSSGRRRVGCDIGGDRCLGTPHLLVKGGSRWFAFSPCPFYSLRLGCRELAAARF